MKPTQTQITQAQNLQAAIGSLDFTQISSDQSIIGMILLMKEILGAYMTDQMSDANADTITSIVSTFSTANAARIQAQINP